MVHAGARRDSPFAARCKSDFAKSPESSLPPDLGAIRRTECRRLPTPKPMKTLLTLRVWQMAALLVAVLVPEISRALGPVNQGNLSANGRRLIYKSVVAVRGKSDDQNRIIVLATVQPLSAAVLEKVNEKDADENVDAEIAAFGKLGSALILSVHRVDGAIFGCEVAHRAWGNPHGRV